MTHDVSRFFAVPQFELRQDAKRAIFEPAIIELDARHRRASDHYRHYLDALGATSPKAAAYADIEPLPVAAFKHHDLVSVPRKDIVRTLRSSGTTGQVPSRVHLDRPTAALQRKVLAAIMASFLGRERLPMLIVDSPRTLRGETGMTARAAGILGMMNLGRDHTWALADDMSLDLDAVEHFAQRYGDRPVLVFGFTFMVWRHLITALEARGASICLPQGVLVTAGGWKKLQSQAVDRKSFDTRVAGATQIERIHDFYGMVEQVGAVYVACEHGYFHASSFSDVRLRDATEPNRIVPHGEVGVLETLSVLPGSYPGHAILTEDRATIHGVDDCPCGRTGTRFVVHGRLPRAETRGCADTYGALPQNAESPMPAIESWLDARTRLSYLRPGAESSLALLDAFSAQLLRLGQRRASGVLTALGFYLRRRNLLRELQVMTAAPGTAAARGLVWHVTPSNAEALFAYTWALSLLAGNHNVVRLSSRLRGDGRAAVDVLQSLLDEPRHAAIRARNVFATWDHHDPTGPALSAAAQMRVLWGSDESIDAIRALPTGSTTLDIAFGARRSLALLGAGEVAQLDEAAFSALVERFLTDGFELGQRACSSPQHIVWLGEPAVAESASQRWWRAVRSHAATKPLVSPRAGIDHQGHLVGLADSVETRVSPRPCGGQPTVVRMGAQALASRASCGDGFFLEVMVSAVSAITEHLRPDHQTVAYFGLSDDQLAELVERAPHGLARVVPIGRALEWSPVWDGYDLRRILTRRVSCPVPARAVAAQVMEAPR